MTVSIRVNILLLLYHRFFDKGTDERGEFVEREGLETRRVDDEDIVTVFGDFLKVETDSLVEATADAVTGDGGLQNFFRDNHGKAGVVTRVLAKNQGEFGTTESFSSTVDELNSATRVKTELFL